MCATWTAYEVWYMWASANGKVPMITWSEHPVYFAVWLCLIPFWREFHFYWIHRAIHWIVPSHPVHFLFNAQYTALTLAGGHHGFEGPVMNGRVPTGSYFHYLHHRYFECNYGEATLPLDKAFGTFRDGLPDGAGANLQEEHKG